MSISHGDSFLSITSLYLPSVAAAHQPSHCAKCTILLPFTILSLFVKSAEVSLPWNFTSVFIPISESMVGAKSVFTYALFMTFPALIFPGYLITNGMRDEASYGTPLFLLLCSKNISPWSDVNTTIVLSSKPLSSRNLRILPTLSSMCFTIPKYCFRAFVSNVFASFLSFSLPFPQLGLCDAYSGFIVNGISGFRFLYIS